MRKALLPLALCLSFNAVAQIPVATQTLLDNVKSPESKNVIKSVLRIECGKDQYKGTGFVVSDVRIVVTNAHVTGRCDATELTGVSPVSSEPVKFSSMVKDDNRDLALLCPINVPPFGLKLSGNEKPLVETEVETWGYPLRYNLAAPVLSRGYVAGFDEGMDAQGRLKNPVVEHLIVNGAINPGNSGGPLIDKAAGNVIGIVVEKWALFSPLVETVITGLENSKTMSAGGFQETDANGVVKGISNEIAVARALREIYEKSQVMVGEAISVSELNAFIKEKKKDLACNSK